MPKLRCRWDDNRGGGSARPDELTAQERAEIWEHVGCAAAGSAAQIRHLASAGDQAAAADAAWAAADTLHAAASALGSRVIRQAASAYDRAARCRYGRIPRPTLAGRNLRRAARFLSAAAFAAHDPVLAQAALVTRLALLAEAVAELRQAQRHAFQAAAARRAAEHLHAAAGRPDPRLAAGRVQSRAVTVLAQESFPAPDNARRPAQEGHRRQAPGRPGARRRRGPGPPRPRRRDQ